jgi:hypothetical protein
MDCSDPETEQEEEEEEGDGDDVSLSHQQLVDALSGAIKGNDHDGIRSILAANPNVKWNTAYLVRNCPCSTCAPDVVRVSHALYGPTVELPTLRLLFDTGVIGPGRAQALFDMLRACNHSRHVARNFLAAVQWHDPHELVAVWAGCYFWQQEALLRIATPHAELREPYIAWMNTLLRAGMELDDDDVLELARASLTYNAAAKEVQDDMPELACDAELFRSWHRRYNDHAHKTKGYHPQVYVDVVDAPLTERCASIKAFLDSFPLEQVTGSDGTAL